MATLIQQLKDDYLFEARITCPDDLPGQRTLLVEWYKQAAADRSSGEVTSTNMEGASASVQFRGSTPEERRQALRLAIEHIEALQADDVAAASAPRVFAIRFSEPPHATLG